MTKAKTFGAYVRECRLKRAAGDRAYSLRQMADRVRIEPSYLSKIERDAQHPPSVEVIRRLADDLGEDSDTLLALAGKIPADLIDIIRARPAAVAELLRSVRRAPTKQISEIARRVRDGNW